MSDMELPITQRVRCPGCGAEMAFRIGASRILICEYCSFAVARTDGGLENIGRVAGVIPTGAHLSLGTRGTYQGRRFTLVGRIQLDWGHGRWDEWYAAFDDGRWGWLAEAAGHYYLSFRVEERVTPQITYPELVEPGTPFILPDIGRFVAADRKRAKYVGAKGELPELIPLDGTAYTSIDLSGPHDSFATLDFSDSDTQPTVYVGREVSFESLALDTSGAEPVEAARVQAVALTCPQCLAPIALRAPDQSKRVVCDHCQALLDTTQGKLRYLDVVVQKASFRFKLGRKASFFGDVYVVIGWLQRGCYVEGDHYTWEEYLLYDPKHAHYRFLVLSEGHWSFVTPIGAGDVAELGKTTLYKGKHYKRFAAVEAKVERVYGEFYWEVAEGETVRAIDYIAPPEGLTCETSRDEVNWSHAVYLTRVEVAKAFDEHREIPRSHKVGSLQPNAVPIDFIWRVLGISVALVVALFIFFHFYAGNRVVFSSNLAAAQPPVDEHTSPGQTTTPDVEASVGETALDPEAAAYQTAVLFTDLIEFPLNHRNLQAELTSKVSQSWVGLDASLIHDETNEVYSFGLESSYYTDDGETEDHRDAITYVSGLPAGHYILRAELTWPKGTPRPEVQLTLTSGVPRGTHFSLALVALFVVPFLTFISAASFEKARWEEGTESP